MLNNLSLKHEMNFYNIIKKLENKQTKKEDLNMKQINIMKLLLNK